MLKLLIAAVVVGILAFGGWQLYLQWKVVNETPTHTEQVVAPVDAASLPGMPPAMDAAYNIAKDQGAPGLKNFLTRYGKGIKDPRLAAIELDYVVLVSKNNIAEARTVFARVKERTPPSSPIYNRVKQLEKTYE
jgi:hypothetical protein